MSLTRTTVTCGICYKSPAWIDKPREAFVPDLPADWHHSTMPDDWHSIGGMYICNDHALALEVDGEKHYLWGKKS
jgi:hypothetical protein